MRFKKKPIVIEAIQFTGKNADEVMEFAKSPAGRTVKWDGVSFIEIETLEGVMYANKNDWIIKGVKGEFYPCKPDIFELTYEELK